MRPELSLWKRLSLRRPVSTGAYGRWVDRRYAASHRALEARVEPVRMARRFPELRDCGDEIHAIGEELLPHYRAFLSQNTGRRKTISLEFSVFLVWWCRRMRPRRILDLGSGFSSLVVRHCLDLRPQPVVWSVDANLDQLEATRRFLARTGASCERLVSWDEFEASDERAFDLILHDLSDRQSLCRAVLRDVLSRVRPGGFVVLDDVQKSYFERYARHVLRDQNLRSFSLRSLDRDRVSRYQLLLARPALSVVRR